MKEKKNIDRLYQEKFKDFEATPREAVWKNVAEHLEKKKRRKLVVLPLWYKAGGIAAALALVLGLTYYLNNINSTGSRIVFEKEEFESPKIDIPQFSPILNETSQRLNSITQNSNEEAAGNSSEANYAEAVVSRDKEENKSGNTSNSSMENTSDFNSSSNASFATGNDEESKSPEINAPADKDKSTESLVSESKIENNSLTKDSFNEKEEEENALVQFKENKEKEENQPRDVIANTRNNKFSVSPFAAPVFYDNLGSGNAIDPQFAQNPSKAEVTMSYGIQVAYAISDKIKIRSGMGKVAMSYNIEGISYNPALDPMAISTINYNENVQNLDIRSSTTYSNEPRASSLFSEALNSPSPGEINQSFGFIEIPLEIEFNLIDSKFGLHLIGGGSSLFLDENAVSLNAENQYTALGEANNLNKLSFSTNIGMGMDYKFTDSFELNLEPIFKYQINTFSNTPNVQPYYFGIYTGVSFKF